MENESSVINGEPRGESTAIPSIIEEFGKLRPETIITEEGLAKVFHRHPQSVKRAVERGELPAPCKMFGAPTWTVGVLVRHIEHRLDEAAKEVKRNERKVTQLRP